LVLLLSCIAASAFAEPKLRNIVTIPIPLSTKYMPPSLPPQPIDETLRLCLTLPTFDPGSNATWTTPVHWEYDVQTRKEHVAEVERVIVNFSESTAKTLPSLMKRLFPRIELTQPQSSASCDVRFVVVVGSEQIADNDHQLIGVTATATVNAFAANGMPLTTFTAVGTEYKKKSLYWSEYTEARTLGEPALQAMIDELFRLLIADAPLNAYVKTKAAERARPSDLETTARFDDSASFFPNGRLDAGEQAKLLFSIRNRGAGPAFGVHLHLSSAGKGLVFPPDTEIGDILPGATKEVSCAIAGGLDVESALQTLRIETLEKRGYGGRPVMFEIATAQLKKPSIEIADIGLSDNGSRARGDANGRPSNGETIEATVLVRNSGPGDAVGAHLAIESAPGVEIVDRKLDLPPIPVNAVREARFLLRLPVTFAGSELSLTVRAEETRGAQVAQASKTAAWPVELKRPLVEVTYRLFDGNSPDSRGNRDGITNNGETLELVLTPVNRGPLAAHDLKIAIATQQLEVSAKPESFAVADLPPFSEAAERRVRVVVPRTFGRDTKLEKLPFNVTIAQNDFPTSTQSIALPFKARRPELVAGITALSALVEGSPASFALDVRNRGVLAAESVRIAVTCDNSGLELLDESGAPTPKLILNVGTVEAQAAVPTIAVKTHVRRNLSKTATSLNLLIEQTDFPPFATHAALNIQKEAAAVVTATPTPAPLPEPAVRASAVPATVSFQRYQNGERVSEERVALRFEVQSQSGLQSVRLQQNHGAVDVGNPKVVGGEGTTAWVYEPQVRLEYGENLFEVVVVTAEGASSNRAMIVNRERRQGRVWVAAVGVSKYANKGVTDLAYAKDDAVAVLDYYRQFGVPEGQLIALYDEQATLANIKRNLGTDLVNKATNPDDTVVLYFAGHGDREVDRGSNDADGFTKYLLPYDGNPSDLFSSALSMEELSRILQRLRPERVVLVLDSCFSGAAGGRTRPESGIRTRAPISDEFLARMATAGQGRVILTASSGQEVAQESDALHHGVFTHYLLEGLRGDADFDRDGRIDVDELYKFVVQQVSAATNGRQNPMRNAPNLTGTVVIGKRLRQ
jgi:hypothetical protein